MLQSSSHLVQIKIFFRPNNHPPPTPPLSLSPFQIFAASLPLLWSDIMCWTFIKSNGMSYVEVVYIFNLSLITSFIYLICFVAILLMDNGWILITTSFVFSFFCCFRPCHNLVFTRVSEFALTVLVMIVGNCFQLLLCNNYHTF